MSPTPRQPLAKVVAAVAQRDALTAHRAVVVQLVCPLARRAALRHALTAALAAPPELVELGTDDDSLGVLRRLNRERDFHRGDGALVLVVEHAEDLRFVRQHAPDLASYVDMTLEVREEAHGDGHRVVQQLRELMRQRHSTIELTGIQPDDGPRRTLDLDDVYLPLADLPRGRDDRPLLLLGHPGSGKTTTLRYLASHGESDPLGVGAQAALLVPLADLAADRQRAVRPVLDFLVDWLARRGVAASGELRQRLGQVVLLWDGLDEVVQREERQAILRELIALHREGGPAHSLITGRSLLVDELRAEGTRSVRLLPAEALRPVDDDALRSYVERFLAAWDPDAPGRQVDTERLVEQLGADPALLALARTPLLLLFLVLIYLLDGRLPDQRTAIYHRLAQVLVERWGRARSLGASPRLQRSGDAWRVLGPLAFTLLASGGTRLHQRALRTELVRLSVAAGEHPDDAGDRADALLSLLQRQTALLVPHGDGEWSFVHPTVAEYFAGVELTRDSARRAEILADPYRADWHEILVFCAGELGIRADDERLTELVTELVERSRSKGRYTAAHPSLLAHILREEPGLRPRVERVLVDRLMEFWWVRAFYNYPSLRVRSEARDLLWDGVERSYGPVLREQLRERFGPRGGKVRWDRLVASVRGGRQMTSLLAWLIPILARYDIDWQPTFERMAQHEDDLVRWAAWWGRWQQAGHRRDAVRAELERVDPGLQQRYLAELPEHLRVALPFG